MSKTDSTDGLLPPQPEAGTPASAEPPAPLHSLSMEQLSELSFLHSLSSHSRDALGPPSRAVVHKGFHSYSSDDPRPTHTANNPPPSGSSVSEASASDQAPALDEEELRRDFTHRLRATGLLRDIRGNRPFGEMLLSFPLLGTSLLNRASIEKALMSSCGAHNSPPELPHDPLRKSEHD